MKKQPKGRQEIFTGQLWKNGRDTYLLSMVDYGKACLIALESGSNRFRNPVAVEHADNISDNEWDLIAGIKINKFILVGNMGDFYLRKKAHAIRSAK
jgi:hypothetical protein